jgi:glycosyltransferase involved in cell wall biosynthesis
MLFDIFGRRHAGYEDKVDHRLFSWRGKPNHSMNIKPRVLIMIAANEISGPGKGVLQFLKHAPAGAFEYVLCNFQVKDRHPGQFVDEARRRTLNPRLLRQRFPFDPQLINQARRVVREQDINVVQTHGYKSNTIGFFLHLFCGLPWIGFAHGYIDDNWRNRLYNLLDRLVLRRADRIVAVSDSMKTLLIRHGVATDKIRTIPNAVASSDMALTMSAQETRRRYGLTQAHRVIGVIGRLSPEKGQMIFLRAMVKAVQIFPDVRALIIGDGQDRPLLEEFCRQKGLSDHVVFLGHQENVGDYYQVLDLLVLPSLSEGLPNALLEAMSFGVPVLATAVGGVPEVVHDGNGMMVPPDDPDMLAEKLIELLKHDALRRAMGLKGKRSLHPRFTPDTRVQRIVSLYEELLSGRDKKVA